MNNLPPPPPLSLTGNLAHNFSVFEQQYRIYEEAIALTDKPAKRRANVLLHVIGQEALKVYNGFSWSEGENTTVEGILQKFKEYCQPLTNVTYERYVFFTRNQKEGESFDAYYTELCNLARTCEFETSVTH